ncbi:MAG: hypothetical protein ACYTEQ_18275 [Planctomycetota bacterium]|jgi:hypothetical protein
MKWAILVVLLVGCGGAEAEVVSCWSSGGVVVGQGDECLFSAKCSDGVVGVVDSDGDTVECSSPLVLGVAPLSDMPSICARASNPADERLTAWLTKLCGDRSN